MNRIKFGFSFHALSMLALLCALLGSTVAGRAHAAASLLGTSASATETSGSNFSLTMSYTVLAGNNRLLVVTSGGGGNTGMSVSSVKFGTSTMTQAITASSGTSINTGIWYLALGSSASSTTANVVISYNKNYFFNLTATAFQDVDQTTPVSGGVSNNAASIAVTSSSGDFVIDAIAGTGSSESATSPSTQQALNTGLVFGGAPDCGSSTQTGGASVTMAWGGYSSSIAHAALNIKQYVPPPTLTSISPSSGPAAGGTSVTVTGTNLTAATVVKFGGTAASSYTVDSATQITCTSPAGSGTVDITVTTAAGTSATSAADQFTYTAPVPTLTSISPSSGPTGGGTSVILTGTGLTGASAVNFGGTAAASYTVNSATQITCTSPAGAAGTVDVTVTTPGGTTATSAADQFTYVAAPTVTSISPANGPTGGGTSVTLTGTNFTGASAVKFGSNAASSYTVTSATQITCTSPAGAAGTVDITVTTVGGTSATSAADQFTYVAAPTVTSISPASGPTGGGTSVTLTGTNFTGASAVKFGSNAASSYTVNSATQITCSSPAGAAGTVDITVTTVGGTSATSAADHFTYVAAPTVTNVSPSSGPASGSTTVTLTGTNFTGASAVTFGSNAASSYTVNSATQITCTSPSGTAGTIDITVTTVGGTSATAAADHFTYVAAPIVTAVSPTSGTSAGGTTVILSGTNFSGASAVKFGSTAASSFTVNAPTQITCTSPAGSAGTVDITVTTIGGTSATSAADHYTYVTITVSPSSLTAAQVGVAYSQTLTAGGGSGGYSFAVTSGALPAGLSLSSGGLLSGTPTAGGTFNFTVTATDSSSITGSQAYSLTVNAPAITLAPTTVPAAQAGVAYTQAITAGGGTATYTYALTAGALPAGLSLSSAGVISGTPTAGGTFNFTVTATDSSTGTGPFTGSRAYTLTVNDATITLSPATLTAAQAGVAYNQPITASGGTATYSYAVTAGALPSGLSLSGTGVLSGTPTAGGTFNFTVTATDSSTGTGPFTGSQAYTLTVNAATITVAPGGLPAPQVGVGYSQTITASGGTASYSFAVTSGTLPTGLTLASGGTLSGTPTAGGTFNFTVTATDSSTGTGPFTGSQAYSVTVSSASITVSPATLPAAQVAASYSQNITAGGGTPAYAFSITAGALPAGLSLSSGGVLSGTPTAGGTFNFTVTATDSSTGTGPFTGSLAYTLTVNAPTVTVAPASIPAAQVGVAYSQTISASGGTAGYTFNVTAGALPAGVTLSSGGALSGTPSAGGTFNFTVTATDSSTGTGPFTGSQAYTLTVNAPAITVAPASLPAAQAGVAYNQTVSASGGTAGYTFNVTAGGLPAGLALSTSGVLSGTATAGGTFNFTITATDSSSGTGPFTGSQAYTLTVNAAAITLAPATLPAAQVNAAYSQTLTASGGTAPYSFSISAGSLPAGVTLSAAGVLSGTSTAPTTSTFTVQATDSSTGTGPFSATLVYTLAVSDQKPVITSQPVSSSIFTGQTASLSVAATGTTLTYQWYQGSSGDTSAPVTGATSATFTSGALNANANFWVRVSNSAGSADSNTALITVFSGLSINGGSNAAVVNAQMQFSVATSTSSSTAVTWTFGDGSSATGATVTHQFTVPGTYTVTATLTDSSGKSVNQSQSVTILPTPFRLKGAVFKLNNGNDSATITGIIHIPAGLTLASTPFSVNVGGNSVTFNFTRGNRATSGANSFSLRTRAKHGVTASTEANFTLKLSGSLAAAFKANAPLDANGLPTQISVLIQFNGIYDGLTLSTSFKAGTNGQTATVKPQK